MKNNVIRASEPQGDLWFLGEFEINASQKDKDTAVTINAYNGGLLRLPEFPLPVVVDLSNPDPSQNVSLLHEHNTMVGHTNRVEVTPTAINASGVLYVPGKERTEIETSAKRGFRWQASVSMFIEAAERTVPGQVVRVNGRVFDRPIIIARKWKWKEITLTKWPVDSTTGATVAASKKKEGAQMNLDEVLTLLGIDPAAATQAQRDHGMVVMASMNRRLQVSGNAGVNGLEPQAPPEGIVPVPAVVTASAGAPAAPAAPAVVPAPAAVQAPAPVAPVAPGFDVNSGAFGEAVTRAVLSASAVQREFAEFPELAASALAEGWDSGRRSAELRAARAAQIVASRPSGLNGFNINSDLRGQVDETQVIAAALAISAGVPHAQLINASSAFTNNPDMQRMARRFAPAMTEQTLDLAERAYQNFGLKDSCIWASNREGTYNGHYWGDPNRVIRASFTTLSLPTLFQNTLNRVLLAEYARQPLLWRELASSSSSRDFRTVDKFRIYGTGQWEVLGQDGALKHGQLNEGAKYTNQLNTLGQINVLTRQDIINDDLGAFTTIGSSMARYGALAPEFALFKTILDNSSSWFSTSNGTQLSGTNPLNIASMKLAHTAFREKRETRTEKDKRLTRAAPLISVVPKILLVPTSLEVAAWEFMNATMFLPTGSTDSTQPDKNFFNGRYDIKSSPYLSDTAISSGASATSWYLLADPSVLNAFDIMFLNGNQVPVIESAEADFNQLGMQFRGYTDFGVAFAEKEAILKVAGA